MNEVDGVHTTHQETASGLQRGEIAIFTFYIKLEKTQKD